MDKATSVGIKFFLDRCVYFYCENTKVSETGTEFETKEYCPHNMRLQEIAAQLQSQADTNSEIQWIQYLREGIQTLKNETEQDFSQPPAESDKLYMAIGERDLIEVAHPLPKEGGDSYRQEGCPRLHLAPIASGRAISRDDSLRQLFAQQTGALAFDSEFDSVLESVLGNCRDSFICLRGVADYRDGSRQKEWQPYAALAAAAVMKAVVIKMEPPTE